MDGKTLVDKVGAYSRKFTVYVQGVVYATALNYVVKPS